MKKIVNKKNLLLGGVLLIGLLLGWLIKPSGHGTEQAVYQSGIGTLENTTWTCSMHPHIHKDSPGQCPICGMDLIPMENSSVNHNPMALEMNADAVKLANIQTTVVGGDTASPTRQIRFNGKVKADERKLFIQPAHIPGRIEQLNVNFTGETVSRGRVLAMVYSPELVTAQQELLQANKIKAAQPELFNAAKNKLKNWKLTEAQINRILENGQPVERFPILSDVGGIALEKRVNLGDYVQRGAPVYEIADLSSVWIQFEVYESDLPWVKVGDNISYSLSSLPGEKFEGIVSFIDPVIDPQTRVALARIEVKNADGKLKPEMFATGHLMKKIQPGTNSWVIPKSAVMWTGERSVVYVKTQTNNKVYFALREVTLGPLLGDSYEVKSGLEQGEEIVTYGTFTVDAAAQLAGKPSMMRPEGGAAMTGHNHGGMNMENAPTNTRETETTQGLSKEAKTAIEKLLEQYVLLKNELVKDRFDAAVNHAQNLRKTVSQTKMSLFTGEYHNQWMSFQKKLETQTAQFSEAQKIEDARKVFIELSDTVIEMATAFGPFEKTFFVQRCPMANQNKGAEWLSTNKEIENPYYGAMMLGCGEVLNTID